MELFSVTVDGTQEACKCCGSRDSITHQYYVFANDAKQAGAKIRVFLTKNPEVWSKYKISVKTRPAKIIDSVVCN